MKCLDCVNEKIFFSFDFDKRSVAKDDFGVCEALAYLKQIHFDVIFFSFLLISDLTFINNVLIIREINKKNC